MSSTIPILFEDSPDVQSGTLGVLSHESVVKRVDVETIKKNLSDLSGELAHIFQGVKKVGDLSLKEIEVAVEINAEGGVALIGSAKVGAKGTITLTFSAPE